MAESRFLKFVFLQLYIASGAELVEARFRLRQARATPEQLRVFYLFASPCQNNQTGKQQSNPEPGQRLQGFTYDENAQQCCG
jgi:hypothetical protein